MPKTLASYLFSERRYRLKYHFKAQNVVQHCFESDFVCSATEGIRIWPSSGSFGLKSKENSAEPACLPMGLLPIWSQPPAGLQNNEKKSVQRCTKGLVEPIRRVAAWLSLPVSAAAAPAGVVAVFNRKGMLRPILPEHAERDPRTVLIDTRERDDSLRTVAWRRERGRFKGQMLIRVNGRKSLFQTIHSVPQTSCCCVFVPV